MEWEKIIRSVLYGKKLRVFHLRYEDLIANPADEMRRAMEFLDIPFEPGMLDYAAQSHDYPKWEAGSSDVVQRRSVSDGSVGKWQRQKKRIEVIHTLRHYDEFLVSLGYAPSNLGSGRVQDVLVAVYDFVQPVLETMSLIALHIRPFVRTRSRVVACLCLLLLAVDILAPENLLRGFGLAGDMVAPLLCFGATFSFAIAFAPALQKIGGPGFGPALVRAGLLMLAYVALLQTSQLLVVGRQRALEPFLFNLFAIFAALIAVLPLILRMQHRARTA
jgi:hypothetical protein